MFDFYDVIVIIVIILETESHPREESGSDVFNLESSEKLTGKKLIFQQMKALYIKRICNSKRNWKGFFCEVLRNILR